MPLLPHKNAFKEKSTIEGFLWSDQLEEMKPICDIKFEASLVLRLTDWSSQEGKVIGRQ